jgi:creatinine amidohydrolase/Fe(II)-dependent formamide hydrolase-like protein
MNAAMSTARLAGSLAVALSLAATVAAQAPRAPVHRTGAPYIETMTWTEIRDAIQAGKKTVIIPTGGTEQNGPHMILGKHNYIITFAAGLMAERLGNTLVAPTVAWVPEGNPNSANFGAKPGVISNPSPGYNLLLDAAVRSLRVHGFTDIILIGDSGGNQGGLRAVADTLNQEWKGTGVRVYAATDYYEKGHADINAWLLKDFGYDRATVGSHAGIMDTSQLMYVHPDGVRKEKIALNGGAAGSAATGVRGDPTKATAELGKRMIDFKVDAGVAQFKTLKAAAPAGDGT